MPRVAKSTNSRAKKIARNFDNAPHTLLLSALQIAKIPRRTRVNHLGGPAPTLSPAGTARVAQWCAELARTLARSPELVAIDAHLADVRALLSDRAFAEARRAEPFDTTGPSIERRVLVDHSLPDATVVARHAVHAAIIAAARPGLVRGPVRDAVQRTIRLLRNRTVEAVGNDPLAMRRFCDELDGRLVRTEVEEVLVARLGLQPTFEDVVWRAPPGPTLARAPTFILGLGPESFGLFAKLGHRYAWNFGTRDHVLATVPDVWMASAVAALIPDP